MTLALGDIFSSPYGLMVWTSPSWSDIDLCDFTIGPGEPMVLLSFVSPAPGMGNQSGPMLRCLHLPSGTEIVTSNFDEYFEPLEGS